MKSQYGKREKKNDKDQFYTDPVWAKKFIKKVDELYGLSTFDLIIEPSAGLGAFLNNLPDNAIGYDLEPKCPRCTEQDFYTVYPDMDKSNILVIGNPPFGRVCSDAVGFFNHAAKWANVIAFIIPQTFHRVSLHNRLDENFHLTFNEDIDGCIFDPPMNAKCCFQVWEKREYKRDKIKLETTHKDWQFLPFGPLDANNQPTPPKGASFAIRAYGGKIGDIVTEGLEDLRPKSWHWIKTDNKDELIERFNSLDYSVSLKTVRQNSLGRGELVKIYVDKYGQ